MLKKKKTTKSRVQAANASWKRIYASNPHFGPIPLDSDIPVTTSLMGYKAVIPNVKGGGFITAYKTDQGLDVRFQNVHNSYVPISLGELEALASIYNLIVTPKSL